VIMLANDSQYWVGSDCVQIFFTCSGLGWVGLGQSADGLGWVGSHKMDPWTTLVAISHVLPFLRMASYLQIIGHADIAASSDVTASSRAG